MNDCHGIIDYDYGDKRCASSGLLLDNNGKCHKCKQLQNKESKHEHLRKA